MDPDAYRLHQVHPLKLGADVSASAVSTVMLWRGRRGSALLVRYGLPAVASLLLIGRADLGRLRATRRGQYILTHMPPEAIGLRLAGDTLMAVGASRRNLGIILAGLLSVLTGWSM